MLRLKVGDLEIEATGNDEFSDRDQFDYLLGKIDAMRGVAKTASANATVAPIKLLSPDGRIRRTREEIAQGLTLEQVTERRTAAQLAAGETAQTVAAKDKGETFEASEDLDLDEALEGSSE